MTFGMNKMYFWALLHISVLIIHCNWLSLKRHWICWGMLTSTNGTNYVTCKGCNSDAPLDPRQDSFPLQAMSLLHEGASSEAGQEVSSSLPVGWGHFVMSCYSWWAEMSWGVDPRPCACWWGHNHREAEGRNECWGQLCALPETWSPRACNRPALP